MKEFNNRSFPAEQYFSKSFSLPIHYNIKKNDIFIKTKILNFLNKYKKVDKKTIFLEKLFIRPLLIKDASVQYLSWFKNSQNYQYIETVKKLKKHSISKELYFIF